MDNPGGARCPFRAFTAALLIMPRVARTSAAGNPPQAVEPPSMPAAQPDVVAQAPTPLARGAGPVAGLAAKSLIQHVDDEAHACLTGMWRYDFDFEIAAQEERGAIRRVPLIPGRGGR